MRIESSEELRAILILLLYLGLVIISSISLYKNKTNKAFGFICVLSWVLGLSVLFGLALPFLSRGDFLFLFNNLYALLRDVSLLLYGVLFLIHYTLPFTKLKSLHIPNADEIAASIANSESFIEKFKESLPSGRSDDDYGFDFIPWIIYDLNERRKRFSKSSSIFLASTICLGLVFIGIVFYFGEKILNERSTDLYEELSKSTVLLKNLDQSVLILDPNISKNFVFNNLVQKHAGVLYDNRTNPDTTLNSLKNTIISIHARLEVNDDMVAYQKSLDSTLLILRGYSPDPINSEYHLRLIAYCSDGIDFIESRSGALRAILANNSTFRSQLDEIQTARRENPLGELARRLVISLIVVSFFFVILRYSAGLYKDHYNQMIETEHDTFEIRKFYIAYKSAMTKQEREVIYDKLFKKIQVTHGEKNTSSDHNKIIANLLQILQKKI